MKILKNIYDNRRILGYGLYCAIVGGIAGYNICCIRKNAVIDNIFRVHGDINKRIEQLDKSTQDLKYANNHALLSLLDIGRMVGEVDGSTFSEIDAFVAEHWLED